MSYDVYLTETFQHCLKTLKKKYRNIKDDTIEIVRKLEDDPTIGDQIPGWNKEIWKIRVASSDMKRGKRGGFRLIYLWKEHERSVYLLAIYFKGEKEIMTSKEMENLLRKVNRELETKKGRSSDRPRKIAYRFTFSCKPAICFFNVSFSVFRFSSFLFCSMICSVSSSTFCKSFAYMSPMLTPFFFTSSAEGMPGRCLPVLNSYCFSD